MLYLCFPTSVLGSAISQQLIEEFDCKISYRAIWYPSNASINADKKEF